MAHNRREVQGILITPTYGRVNGRAIRWQVECPCGWRREAPTQQPLRDAVHDHRTQCSQGWDQEAEDRRIDDILLGPPKAKQQAWPGES